MNIGIQVIYQEVDLGHNADKKIMILFHSLPPALRTKLKA